MPSNALTSSSRRCAGMLRRVSLTTSKASCGSAPAWLRPTRSFVSVTAPVFEKYTMKVPTMGDSITEGTIVEWSVQVGQMVQEEDVIALIETDKVTVDIKATVSGVVTQQYGAVDDTVDVGAALCEIDTAAEATATPSEASAPAAAAPAPTPVPKPVAASAPTPPPSASSRSSAPTGHRTPSIHFLGKDGWARARVGQDAEVVYEIPANYGRLKFTDDEMEALVMGGANIAPEIKQYSGGARFSI